MNFVNSKVVKSKHSHLHCLLNLRSFVSLGQLDGVCLVGNTCNKVRHHLSATRLFEGMESQRSVRPVCPVLKLKKFEL